MTWGHGGCVCVNWYPWTHGREHRVYEAEGFLRIFIQSYPESFLFPQKEKKKSQKTQKTRESELQLDWSRAAKCWNKALMDSLELLQLLTLVPLTIRHIQLQKEKKYTCKFLCNYFPIQTRIITLRGSGRFHVQAQGSQGVSVSPKLRQWRVNSQSHVWTVFSDEAFRRQHGLDKTVRVGH